jgi:hypothetical protein
MVTMGCGCGSNNTRGNKTPRVEERKSTVSRVKQSIKNVWEKTQSEQPSHVVKRINKKTK